MLCIARMHAPACAERGCVNSRSACATPRHAVLPAVDQKTTDGMAARRGLQDIWGVCNSDSAFVDYIGDADQARIEFLLAFDVDEGT